jgi:hypothetical protein
MSDNRRAQLVFVLTLGGILLATAATESEAQTRRRFQHLRVGTVVKTLPSAVTVSVGRDNFYLQGGVFYRFDPHGYVVIPRPLGAIATALPRGATPVVIQGRQYFRVQGVLFAQVEGGYMVSEEPAPVSIQELPMGYETVVVDGEEIYYHQGTFFRYDPGRDEYRVIMPSVGAEVAELPPTAVSETISGELFFSVGPVRYRPAVRQGKTRYVVVRIR